MSDLSRADRIATEPRRRLVLSLGSAVAVCSVALWLGLSSASGAKPAQIVRTFNFTGGEQTFTVPGGVTSIYVEAVGGRGASGGGFPAGGFRGGYGAFASATLAVSPGQVLFVNVGGNGGLGSTTFNGGGVGGNNGTAFIGGSGGGATDIRTNSRDMVGNTLATRLVTAGGGGGAGGASGDTFSGGGFGGTANSTMVPPGYGADGTGGGGPGPGGLGGNGATPTAAGGNGNFGEGGAGGASAPGGAGGGGGGGGGGVFGGGGGGNGSDSGYSGGGGGAGSSGFASTAKNTGLGTDFTGVPMLRIFYETGGKSGLKFGKVILNKRKGTATLPVTVPGSGNLTVGGKGVVKNRPGLGSAAWLARQVAAAGTYKLKIKAKGRKKAKLFSTGKVKVKAVVRFKPTSGDAVKVSKRITLKKN